MAVERYKKSLTDDPLYKVWREIVTRGGHWARLENCRSAARIAVKADAAENSVGFRAVCDAPRGNV